MNALLWLSVCSAMLMLTRCGNIGGHEEQSPEYSDTATVSYNYSATFKYFGNIEGHEEQSPEYSDTATMSYDYDYNVTFEYYFVTGFADSSKNASGIGRLSLVVVLGWAVLQMWI